MFRHVRSAGAVAAIVAGFAAAAVAPAAAAAAPADIAFDWEVDERTEGGDDGNGRYPKRYYASTHPQEARNVNKVSTVPINEIEPRSWPVQVSACGSTATDDAPITGYRFVVPAANVDERTGTCRATLDLPAEGRYAVDVEITWAGGSHREAHEVEVRDYLIVSFGDSYGSGEGVRGLEDRRCGRSVKAGAPYAARKIERRERKSSVTFLHLACSGAKLTTGILRPYAGVRKERGEMLMPQLDELLYLVPTRTIDALVVSIGGNDVGFSKIIVRCITNKIKSCTNETSSAMKTYRNGLAQLLVDLPDFRSELVSRFGTRLPQDRVLLVGYPDFTHDENGNYCKFGPLSGGFMTQAEWRWAANRLLDPLTDNISDFAARQNPAWTFGRAPAAFLTHGYCSSDAWMVTLTNTFSAVGDKNGAFHPNAAGQRAMGRASILPTLNNWLVAPAP
jgi:GDSL-like Lipase/Acylhydrolase family